MIQCHGYVATIASAVIAGSVLTAWANDLSFANNFQLRDQSMWSGNSTAHEAKSFIGASWEGGSASLNIGTPPSEIGVPRSGDTAGGPSHTDSGSGGSASGEPGSLLWARFEASATAGRLGLEVTYGPQGGTISANIPTTFNFSDVPMTVEPGQRGVRFSVSYSIGEDYKFWTKGPNFAGNLALVADGRVTARARGASSLLGGYDTGDLTISFDGTHHSLGSALPGHPIQIDIPPVSNIRLETPARVDISSDQNTRAGRVLKAKATTGPVLSVNTDVDALISNLTGFVFPPPGVNAAIPGLSLTPVSAAFEGPPGTSTNLTFNYIDLVLSIATKLQQDFTFALDAMQFNYVIRDEDGHLVSRFAQPINYGGTFEIPAFDVPSWVRPGSQLSVDFDAYPLTQLVNKLAKVASLDTTLTMFGIQARLLGVALYEDALISKTLTLLESHPVTLHAENVYFGGTPDFSIFSQRFFIPVAIPEPGTMLVLTSLVTLLMRRCRR